MHNIGARLNKVIRCLFIVEQQQLMNRHALSYKPIRDDFCTPNAIPSDIGKNACGQPNTANSLALLGWLGGQYTPGSTRLLAASASRVTPHAVSVCKPENK